MPFSSWLTGAFYDGLVWKMLTHDMPVPDLFQTMTPARQLRLKKLITVSENTFVDSSFKLSRDGIFNLLFDRTIFSTFKKTINHEKD